ncbi:hypothetical protein HMPREF1153_1695 [Selenomonas sp. CM52]|nr:hypothetical protein HMPREF1153_1695 [Selenomonas sp. CM52]
MPSFIVCITEGVLCSPSDSYYIHKSQKVNRSKRKSLIFLPLILVDTR